MSQLAPLEKTDKKQKRRHKTMAQRARQVVSLARIFHPSMTER